MRYNKYPRNSWPKTIREKSEDIESNRNGDSKINSNDQDTERKRNDIKRNGQENNTKKDNKERSRNRRENDRKGNIIEQNDKAQLRKISERSYNFNRDPAASQEIPFEFTYRV